jgi:hypothetical protein
MKNHEHVSKDVTNPPHNLELLQIEELEERTSFSVQGACACTCSCNCTSTSCVILF